MTYRYRALPDLGQVQTMGAWLETCRRVRNFALRELKDWLASRKSPVDRCSLVSEYVVPADRPFPSLFNQQKALTAAKANFPNLKAVNAQVLQQALRALHQTWERFREKGCGFPRFKKLGQVRSFLFPQFKSNPIADGWITLPSIGKMPIVMHRPIPDGFKVKQVRVLSRARGTQWYVCVTIEADVSVPDVLPHGRAVGVDLGLERFVTISDGTYRERPKFLRALQRKLKLLQRRAARKQKRSHNWERAQVKVARLHHHIANVRRDWHFKVAHQLCREAGTIFVEDLNCRGLARGMLRRDCVDAAFGQFLNLLEWVALKEGVYVERIDPSGTSQTCPECGATVAKDLSTREHNCPECGYRVHRDHAAAEVVLQRGLSAISTRG